MAPRPQPQTCPGTDTVRRFAFELPALTGSVARARRLAEERLILWGCGPDIRDTVALVVSELVTNAVVHTASDRVVCEIREGEETLRIAVRDEGGAAGPRIRDCGEDERGRGLLIVDALCSAWGADRTGHGTAQVVWAELAHGMGEPC
ncbi:ATP-binding protein [Streptomyces zaomyceticus]|uniref:ATP-binding protein n=1 Tax=Streptomyces zaomyceticus TaxID=68286 RepID=UPI003429FCAD